MADQRRRDRRRQFSDVVRQLSEAFARGFGLLGEAMSAMYELKWPIHGALDVADAGYIVRTYQAQDKDKARCLIEEYLLEQKYDEKHLRLMVAGWQGKKWLSRRIPALRQAVEAHIAGSYWVSIPTMLPHIEGMILERHGHQKGRVPFRELKRYAESMLSSTSIERALLQYLIEEVLHEWEHGDEVILSLNRHSVLHGADLEYGTAANSLKTILVIDFLQDNLMRLVAFPSGDCYHAIGCSRVSLARTDLQFFGHYREARFAGKKPCKLCRPPA
ncbi:MAG: hypothetical protein KBC96_10755 [Armatimonadetes bacterium]|nr:hypothetical protein [Armatimonadota bacterium]